MVLTTWKVIYDDGTECSDIKYTDIDRTRLKQFVVYRDNFPTLILHLDSNKKLIFRRRVVMNLLSVITEEVYLIGWQEKLGDRTSQFINFIFKDGHIETIDGFKEGHKFFYPVNFLPEETI